MACPPYSSKDDDTSLGIKKTQLPSLKYASYAGNACWHCKKRVVTSRQGYGHGFDGFKITVCTGCCAKPGYQPLDLRDDKSKTKKEWSVLQEEHKQLELKLGYKRIHISNFECA
jgi:hypothetical protein